MLGEIASKNAAGANSESIGIFVGVWPFQLHVKLA